MPDHTIVFPNVVGRHQRMGDGTVSLEWLRHRIKTAVAKLGVLGPLNEGRGGNGLVRGPSTLLHHQEDG
jgi:hypothetical protein